MNVPRCRLQIYGEPCTTKSKPANINVHKARNTCGKGLLGSAYEERAHRERNGTERSGRDTRDPIYRV